ncbi:MAG: hypothetical protein ACJAU6_002409 [Alphaproteobacteria bacterium]|jgi:hypothetical protein
MKIMENYPAVALMVKHGTRIAIATGLAPVVAIAIIMIFCTLHWGWLVAAIGLGVSAAFLMKVFVELVQIIVDMLLPQ